MQAPPTERRGDDIGADIRVEGGALRLGQREVPLYSGAIHYFRHPRGRWREQLEGLRELGFELIETYVPWGVHEQAPGEWDFGSGARRHDLGAFLDLAHELGLLVFLRPGPHINAELTYFGLPERIVHDPDCQARTARGTPLPLLAPPQGFPVPSVASEAFFEAAGEWMSAVGEVVAPRIWPDGPVVLVQVDNESAYYFRDGPYEQDHHPDAIAAYRAFLRGRHGTLQKLVAAHGGTAPRRWDQVLPPERFEASEDDATGLGRYMDWIEFRGRLLLSAIDRHAEQLRDAGLQALPTVHNVPMGDAGLPYSLGQMDQHVNITGLDYYESPSHLDRIKRRTLRLAGSARLPYAPELGLGAPPWFVPRRGSDALQTALCVLAHGVRGFNVYMAVNRDRWWGGLLHEDGAPTAQAAQCRQLLAALQRLRFHALSMPVEVGLCVPAEYARLSQATHTLGPASPSLMALTTGNPTAACSDARFGFREAVQRAWWPLLQRTADALDRASVPYVFIDSAAPIPEGIRLMFAPAFEFADPARLERLKTFQDTGGAVVCGPDRPTLDAMMQPLGDAPVPDGEPEPLSDPQALDALIGSLRDRVGLHRPAVVSPWPLQASAHVEGGELRVLFLMNPGDDTLLARVQHPAHAELIDVLTTERYTVGREPGIEMAPRSCRMFEVRSDGQPGGSE